jgi:hypothetical protein
MRQVVVMLAIGLASRGARADVAIDWAKGVVTAEGIGIADRHAPNPAVARGTSRRGAEEAARVQLAKGLGALPVASAGSAFTTVAAKAKDPATKARIDRAVAQAVAVAAQPETDGAWKVTMAVPIEAIRQAIDDGPRTVAATGDDAGAAVIVVDGATAKPAIGWTVGTAHVATVWLKDVPAWAKDATHVKASSAKAGKIELADAGTVGNAATLYVIVTP